MTVRGSEKYKIVLAGDVAVGKTSLISHFVTGIFKTDYKATIGVDIFSKKIIINHKEIDLQIWDIAGQTSFRKFRQQFFAGSRGALLVFDLTIPQSLDNILQSWIEDIKKVTGEIPLVLVGNKSDLTELLAISPDLIANVLSHHDIISDYYHTSALTGENVERVFYKLISLGLT